MNNKFELVSSEEVPLERSLELAVVFRLHQMWHDFHMNWFSTQALHDSHGIFLDFLSNEDYVFDFRLDGQTHRYAALDRILQSLTDLAILLENADSKADVRKFNNIGTDKKMRDLMLLNRTEPALQADEVRLLRGAGIRALDMYKAKLASA